MTGAPMYVYRVTFTRKNGKEYTGLVAAYDEEWARAAIMQAGKAVAIVRVVNTHEEEQS